MTKALYQYPASAQFGRSVPKNSIYQHGTPSAAIKQLFVRQVAQITWQFKLAPETINLPSTRSVPEIQVFGIALKGDELKTEVLRSIDLAIPFPIVFELQCDDKVQPIAAYKRPSEADARQWVTSDYFAGDWTAADAPRAPLPVVFDLEALYHHMLRALLPHPARSGEALPTQVERMDRILRTERELARCEAQLKKEKQYNRQVEINAVRRNIMAELAGLKS